MELEAGLENIVHIQEFLQTLKNTLMLNQYTALFS